ncbi:hypothetical protein [Nitrosomonas ureae]|uniref:Uncharacterized protein n=1 Tax=Nitrosomonas ureae TaxID=44577 RepID=A0A1H2HY66_9PROT|nr:hypothetical protein [Nitrosomonas ureae]ALQ51705.1 hypothetical protein ATY38_11020 [Nitrosomonas ureae]SDU36636.1 hypothetical protein SAMN05216406_1732 [Nitrosomonas ureae]
MKPAIAHVSEFIFKLVNSIPWLFPNWLTERASYYSSDEFKKHENDNNLILTGSFLEGDFSWKAVGVVIRIDHQELELIHKWMKRKTPAGSYDPKRDSDSFSTKYTDLGRHRSLGWISFGNAKFFQNLAIIESIETICKSCYITFDRLPNGFTYLSLYFLLSSEATSRIHNTNLRDVESYFYFQSFNPFSKHFKVLILNRRNQVIKEHIKEILNTIFNDVRLATISILNTWNIKKDLDEIITVADFYRDSDAPYFKSFDDQKDQNVDIIDSRSNFVLFDRNDHFYDAKICNDSSESYCEVQNDEDIDVDVFFIKSQLKETFDKWDDFPNCGLTISDSHLFLSLLLDCHKQYKKIAENANSAILQYDDDLEVRYKVLFNSLIKLDALDENIIAVEKYISFGCIRKYQARVEMIIEHQKKIVQELRSSIDKRCKSGAAELQIKSIKFHRCYSRLFTILIFIQIFLAAFAIL